MHITSDQYWHCYCEVDPETGVEVLRMEDLVVEADIECTPHGEPIVRIHDISVIGWGSKEHISVSLFKAKTGSAKALGERIRASLENDADFFERVLERAPRRAA